MTLGTLPAGKKPYSELGASLKNPDEELVDSQDRLSRAAFVMIAGVGAALVRSGWTVETGPGRPLNLTKDGAAIVPGEVISRLINEPNSQTEWQAKCDALGLSGVPLAPSGATVTT